MAIYEWLESARCRSRRDPPSISLRASVLLRTTFTTFRPSSLERWVGSSVYHDLPLEVQDDAGTCECHRGRGSALRTVGVQHRRRCGTGHRVGRRSSRRGAVAGIHLRSFLVLRRALRAHCVAHPPEPFITATPTAMAPPESAAAMIISRPSRTKSAKPNAAIAPIGAVVAKGTSSRGGTVSANKMQIAAAIRENGPCASTAKRPWNQRSMKLATGRSLFEASHALSRDSERRRRKRVATGGCAPVAIERRPEG